MSIGWNDDFVVLPDTTADEDAAGWGDDEGSNDDRLVAERPPHWS
jgi:hypothetical protein